MVDNAPNTLLENSTHCTGCVWVKQKLAVDVFLSRNVFPRAVPDFTVVLCFEFRVVYALVRLPQ